MNSKELEENKGVHNSPPTTISSQEESETLIRFNDEESLYSLDNKKILSLKNPYYNKNDQQDLFKNNVNTWALFSKGTSFGIILYLAYNLFRFAELFVRDPASERSKYLQKEYASNGENVIFSNQTITVFLYSVGILTITYNVWTIEEKLKLKSLLLKSSPFAIFNIKSMKAYLAFSLLFTIGKIFQMLNFNYNHEFETLTEQERELKEEGKSTVEAWKALFMILVIAVTVCKVFACFANILCFKHLFQLLSKNYSYNLYQNMYLSREQDSNKN